MGSLVLHTDDARGLYETLKERGVTDFTQEPMDHFYGTDMGIRALSLRSWRRSKRALPPSAKLPSSRGWSGDTA